MSDDDVRRLGDLVGILPRYHDLSGVEHETPMETYRAILDAMLLPSDTAKEQADRIEAADAERPLPETIVVTAGEDVFLGAQHAVGEWTLALEDGSSRGGHAEHDLALGSLPMGYHTLSCRGFEILVIAAPRHAPMLSDVTLRPKSWGVTGAIYALRSDRNAGVGDFEDLAQTGEIWAKKGADFIGVNPLHALGWSTTGFSPYSPTYRKFLNTTHLSLDNLPSYTPEADVLAAMEAARGVGDIDYAAVDRVMKAALPAAFTAFRENADQGLMAEFDAFRRAHDVSVELLGVFEAISAAYGANPDDWPMELRSPSSPAVAAFAETHADEVAFHIYLQWIADRQLADVAGRLSRAGMSIGLYADLAVGVRPDAAEPWARPDIFARDVSLGVPPDAFNAAGQVWGLAPINPDGLAKARYVPMIETLRAVMRHAGMIRIDHAIGLMRCFWVPEGGLPGAYVQSPLDILLAIVRLEARRQDCIVIGEDLGVVPDGLRHALYESGLYGVSVLQFEREHDGGFRKPEHYPVRALASFGTHDTPTFAGYWKGADIETRQALGQYDDTTAGHARDGRAWDRHKLLVSMRDAGVLPEGFDPDRPQLEPDIGISLSMHALLAHSASEIVAVQVDDALGSDRQPNFPGTTTEYPNWRVPMPVPVDALCEAPGVTAVADVMNHYRPKITATDKRRES